MSEMRPAQRLLAMLRDTYRVEHTRTADVVLKSDGRLLARLHAPESAVARYASAHARDGLLALGPVGDDTSGVTAALGLLSVHVEELIATATHLPIHLQVTQEGVSVLGSSLSR
jgi:hypothetical protein